MWCKNGPRIGEFFDREHASAKMVDIRAGSLAPCEGKSYVRSGDQSRELSKEEVRPLANRQASHKQYGTYESDISALVRERLH